MKKTTFGNGLKKEWLFGDNLKNKSKILFKT